jgi:hypothetical protein
MIYRPFTAMPCRLPSDSVAAGGKCVSLLQAAKHLQTKPEAVVMRKLQRNAVHQPSRSDHTDYFLTIPKQCLRRGLPDRTTARQHDSTTEEHRSSLCIMWLSPIASWDPQVRHVMSMECKAHLPRGPAFQCRQRTIAETLHTQDMGHIRCFAASANNVDASVVVAADVTRYD